jgi:general L-amino acid transport system permease protein
MNSPKIPLWRNSRVLSFVSQAIALGLLVGFLVYLGHNFSQNTQRLGLSFGWLFLFDRDRPTSFAIGDSPISFQSTDPYSRALLVGLLNSLRVVVIGIIFASILGLGLGLARLSDNWLVKKLSGIYIEIFRNTPLLLQLFFWYFAVFLRLPKIDAPLNLGDRFFFSNQGVYLPFPVFNLRTGLAIMGILLALWGLLYGLWQSRHHWGEGYRRDRLLQLSWGLLMAITIIWGIDWQFPRYDAQVPALSGGVSLSPEFATLLLGLTIYTAAFIAEVVRAGIQVVPQGQWEAARALGFKSGLMMRLVIIPQALRVMIPPLTNEYLNLIKNSSLAIAIGYNDVYAITSTIANQTGKAVEMLLVVMASYLLLNLGVSALMNQLNRRVQIIER